MKIHPFLWSKYIINDDYILNRMIFFVKLGYIFVILLDNSVPTEYLWFIVCHDTELVRTTTKHLIEYAFENTECYLSVTITPSLEKIQRIHEKIEIVADFNVGEIGDMEYEKDTRVTVALPGDFPTTGVTYVWQFENSGSKSTTTTAPEVNTVFPTVGVFRSFVNIHNRVKSITVNFTVIVYEELRGRCYYFLFSN